MSHPKYLRAYRIRLLTPHATPSDTLLHPLPESFLGLSHVTQKYFFFFFFFCAPGETRTGGSATTCKDVSVVNCTKKADLHLQYRCCHSFYTFTFSTLSLLHIALSLRYCMSSCNPLVSTSHHTSCPSETSFIHSFPSKFHIQTSYLSIERLSSWDLTGSRSLTPHTTPQISESLWNQIY